MFKALSFFKIRVKTRLKLKNLTIVSIFSSELIKGNGLKASFKKC